MLFKVLLLVIALELVIGFECNGTACKECLRHNSDETYFCMWRDDTCFEYNRFESGEVTKCSEDMHVLIEIASILSVCAAAAVMMLLNVVAQSIIPVSIIIGILVYIHRRFVRRFDRMDKAIADNFGMEEKRPLNVDKL